MFFIGGRSVSARFGAKLQSTLSPPRIAPLASTTRTRAVRRRAAPRARPLRHAPDRRAAPRPLPRRAEELGAPAGRLRLLLLRRRLARADHALRRARGHRAARLRHGDRLARRRPRPRDAARIFIQSRLPEHAELFTLLAMGTPLGWLERVPTYKDQIEKLKDRDLATYGFLGYPLLQAADILIYKAAYVPVGEDQASHVELTREVARRFNHLYGREPRLRRAGRARRWRSSARTTRATSRQRARPSARPAAPRRWPRARRIVQRGRGVAGWTATTANCCSATCAAPARPSCTSRRRCTPK